jgi:hypothetical protein
VQVDEGARRSGVVARGVLIPRSDTRLIPAESPISLRYPSPRSRGNGLLRSRLANDHSPAGHGSETPIYRVTWRFAGARRRSDGRESGLSGAASGTCPPNRSGCDLSPADSTLAGNRSACTQGFIPRATGARSDCPPPRHSKSVRSSFAARNFFFPPQPRSRFGCRRHSRALPWWPDRRPDLRIRDASESPWSNRFRPFTDAGQRPRRVRLRGPV